MVGWTLMEERRRERRENVRHGEKLALSWAFRDERRRLRLFPFGGQNNWAQCCLVKTQHCGAHVIFILVENLLSLWRNEDAVMPKWSYDLSFVNIAEFTMSSDRYTFRSQFRLADWGWPHRVTKALIGAPSGFTQPRFQSILILGFPPLVLIFSI